MSTAEMKILSAQAVAAWNERRFDDFYALYHPGVVHHSADGHERHGVAELRALYDSALQICPDLTIRPITVVSDAEAGLMASMQIESGTTAAGEPFGFQGMLFLRLDADGLIIEAWEQVQSLTAP